MEKVCSSFGPTSTDLCSVIASANCRLCVDFVDPHCLRAFVACRLITLDKCPGVHPIGIGEVIRRVVSKAILSVLKFDILHAAGLVRCVQARIQGVKLRFMPYAIYIINLKLKLFS